MRPSTYVMIAWGANPALHRRATLALSSIARYASASSRIRVVTDMPQAYSPVATRIETVSVTREEIQAAAGPRNEPMRLKLVFMLEQVRRSTGSTCYVDSDTVCVRSLEGLQERLDSGEVALDEFENLLSDGVTKTYRQMWRIGKGHDFAGYSIDRETPVWNAGVIGLPPGSAYLVEKALAVCDAMLDTKMLPRFTEQLAFSMVLHATGRLRPASSWFLHYWSNKPKWDAWIESWYTRLERAGFDAMLASWEQDCAHLPAEHRDCKPLQPRWMNRLRELLRL